MELKFLFKNEAASQTATELVQNDACNFRLSRKYETYYRFLRPIMPIAVKQLLQRRRPVEVGEDWFLPLDSMRSITQSLQAVADDLTTIHPWPDGAPFSFVLTHDVETAEGVKNIPRIAELEARLGFRSSWNLIPYKYKIDMGLVNDLKSRGFEIGIHGYNHDGRLFLNRQIFDYRADKINQAIKKYNAIGFRAPMVHRNLDWLQSLNVEYDASCFDIDPFQAVPGGVGTIWPFIAGRFVELPYTMPQDHTLFISLGETDDRVWKKKLDFIIRHQGMALMLTHPDYLTDRKESEIYRRFLEYVKEIGPAWHATPCEVTRWWREREQLVEFGLFSDTNSIPDPAVTVNRPVIARLKFGNESLQFVGQ